MLKLTHCQSLLDFLWDFLSWFYSGLLGETIAETVAVIDCSVGDQTMLKIQLRKLGLS